MTSRSKEFQGLVLIVLFLAFIGYFFSFYNGNEDNASICTNLILVCSIIDMALFAKKEKLENKFLDALTKVDGVLLVIWGVTQIVQLIV